MEFTDKDYCDLSHSLGIIIHDLIPYEMPLGSSLYYVYSLLKLSKEIIDYVHFTD